MPKGNSGRSFYPIFGDCGRLDFNSEQFTIGLLKRVDPYKSKGELKKTFLFHRVILFIIPGVNRYWIPAPQHAPYVQGILEYAEVEGAKPNEEIVLKLREPRILRPIEPIQKLQGKLITIIPSLVDNIS